MEHEIYIRKMSKLLSKNRKNCMTGNRTEKFSNLLPLHQAVRFEKIKICLVEDKGKIICLYHVRTSWKTKTEKLKIPEDLLIVTTEECKEQVKETLLLLQANDFQKGFVKICFLGKFEFRSAGKRAESWEGEVEIVSSN